MGENDLTISGARVVLPGGVVPATVVVRGGRIAEVRPGRMRGPGILDIDHAVLIPGVVDTHVHVNEPGRTEWEGFESATRAAAAGGVTSVVVMPLNCRPAATSAETLRGGIAAGAGEGRVGFGGWGGGGAG